MPSISSSSDTLKDTAATTLQPLPFRSTTVAPVAVSRLTTEELRKLSAQLEISQKWYERSLARETLQGFMDQIIVWPEEIACLPRLKHIQEWMGLVAGYDKLLVEASRDHGKSTFFSFALPLFWVQKIKNPRDAFGIAMFAYSEGQSQKYIKRIRQEIETNPHLKWLLPKSKSSVWDSGTLDMSNGCWIESYGFGSSFRGRHPKKILVDDACKESGSGSMSIEQQIQYFSGTLIPAVKKKGSGQIIVTGNPIDKIDFLEWLEKNKAFHFKAYPAVNDKGEPLAPELYDLAAIEDKRSAIPAHIFAREYMLKRVSSEDARFKEEWITYYDPKDHMMNRNSPSMGEIPLYKVMTIDPAMSPVGDALAGVVTGTTGRDYVDVLEAVFFRGDLDAGVSRMVDMMVQHRPDFIGVEDFAMQALYKDAIEKEIKRRGLYFNVQSVGRDSKKKKAARIEGLQPILSQRRLRFLPEQKGLVNQLLLWDPSSKSNDDDGIDALAWQVPLWRKPSEEYEAPREAPEGSFNDAFEKIRLSKQNTSYIGKLFADMGTA